MDGKIESVQSILHYSGHWLIPFLIAAVIWGQKWVIAGLTITMANLIDLDHLFANPVFDPERCSIGFHLLHGWQAMVFYTLMIFLPKWWVKALGIGAMWHLAVDYGDCLMMKT